MITIKKLLKKSPMFLNNWKTKEEVFNDFENYYSWDNKEKDYSKYEGINILFASYGTDNYSGDAFVLFEKDKELYEVNGGHCSCYGLEGQWNPEKVNLAELENRLVNGRLGIDDWSGNNFSQELKQFLEI